MGGSNSSDAVPTFNYGQYISDPLPGETGILRHSNCIGEITASAQGISTIQDVAIRAFSLYPNNQFLGTNINGVYCWKTYAEIQELSTSLGSAIIQNQFLGLSVYNDQEYRCIGIYSRNREEWIVSDIAAVLYNFSLVPFYDTLGAESMEHIINQTELSTIIISGENLEKFLDQKRKGKTGEAKNLITLDRISPSEISEAESLGIQLFFIGDLYELGRQNKLEYIQTAPESCYTISYTSGTTGLPKGVIITHRSFVSKLISAQNQVEIVESDVMISYLPLPHIYERTIYLQILYSGCSTGFYSGDIMKLREDIIAVRPTILPWVPRLLTRYYDGIMAKFSQLPPTLLKVFQAGVSTKIQQLRHGRFDHPLYDKLFFNSIKQIIGGRVRIMLCGAAAIKPEVLQFMKIAFCCNIMEGYGQTETLAVGSYTKFEDPIVGSVGGVGFGIEMKLVDIPEMNYLSTHTDEQGVLRPQGEICFRGPTVFSGYFKEPEISAETLDADGWNHTGDVGELLPDLTLKIIDRKKNLFKLSQGEYVAPERIENIHMLSPYVSMSFVYGDSAKNDLVAIIVPDELVVMTWAKENQIQGTFKEICGNEVLQQLVLEELNQLGTQYSLVSFEKVQRIYLESDPFTIEAGLLTPTMKLIRFAAKKYYKDVIERLYSQGQ